MASRAAAGEEVIRGVASVLQDAASALARLGVQAANQPLGSAESSGESLADAAAALAQVAAQFTAGQASTPVSLTSAARAGNSRSRDDENEPAVSTYEFCDMHGLDAWVGEALDLLKPKQRGAVMNPEMNMGRARNPNGIVMSRIKNAAPLDQRLDMFVQINGLSEGVVDRISTLTQEQSEALLDSGFKILKAENPSAVAMKRITDVIKTLRAEGSSRGSSGVQAGRQQDGWNSRGSAGVQAGRQQAGWSNRGSAGVQAGRQHDSWNNHSFRQRPDDRSRTPAPPWSKTERGGHGGSHSGRDMPSDVKNFMDAVGLDWWCGEVLKRLSLWQRQQIIKDMQGLHGVRNPSGVVMSRVREAVDTGELMSIFIDLNNFDSAVQQELSSLTPEQQVEVISPGIYLQNVRNPSTAVRSRINNVLAGREAVGRR